MKIYEQSVRKPISTALIFIGVIVLGLFSLNRLAVDMYPKMDIPSISIITSYPGANAQDIETNITRILEDNLNTVSNMKKITSKSSDNVSLVTLEMQWGCDLNEAANEVRDAVSRVQTYLPDDADFPVIFKLSSSMFPVVMLSATADESYAALTKILDDKLVNVINRIDGVGAVSVMGAPTRELQVNIDPNKLEAYNLTVEQIGQIIQQENANIPGGTIDVGSNTFAIKADGEFKSSDELLKIIVANRGGRDIYLTDVAEVKDTLAKSTMDERVNGQRGVRIIVQKQSDANTVRIAGAVYKALPEIQRTLPPDVKIDTIMDGSESIRDSINSLQETVILALVFVILVVLFFLGRWRATIIICLTIPVSLVAAFIYLNITGSTLNIISLSSLSIAIGMVVDDAIVVLENITKHIERGSSPRESSIYGTNEVWLAVIATTLTVVAVFFPLTMVSGMAGILFKDLGWIVTIVILISTVAAITLTPMMTALMLKARKSHTYEGLGVMFKPVDRALDRLDNAYARLLTWAVHHKSATILFTGAIFISSLLLMMRVPTEFVSSSDNGIIAAEVKLNQNIAVEMTSQVARQIDSVIYRNYPEVELVSASAGASSSSNFFMAMRSSGSYIINYVLKLNKLSERDRTIFEISDDLRLRLDSIPAIAQYKVTPAGSGGGFGSSTDIQVKVFGYDFEQSNRVALALRDSIAKVPGARDVQLSRDDLRPEYNVTFDRDRLSALGLNSATAATFVRNRINGLNATKYREDGDEYDVYVRYAERFRTSFEDVENITLYTPGGKAVKLRDVGTIEEQMLPPAIERENRQRVVYVNGSLGKGYPLGVVVQGVNQVLADYDFPEGIVATVGGSVEDQQESFGDLFTLLGLIIMLVYVVMATQFESLKMPLIIMVSMLFAFTGVFLALYITNTPLGMIALIGAIMLVGIVVKNGIVIVDFTNLLRERGSTVNEAVIVAGKSRLRPVLMTSLTTILGMLPLALGMGEGSEIWQPMGIAVIGGLTFSTLLTLLVVPVLYSSFVRGETRRQRRERKLQEAKLRTLE
ncbi:MAG: efflux RND transporter permease subunit [Rikenellaceae bacterium]|jgi:HAE1 family hydrophobic/amphiphilic exporter-1|nr:efflux RND transporter permease subunit [Rikenellaceae bacterium]